MQGLNIILSDVAQALHENQVCSPIVVSFWAFILEVRVLPLF